MGIYDQRVDPFALVVPTRTSTAKTPADTPAPDSPPSPDQGSVATLIPLPRVPDEFRHLLSKKALTALESDADSKGPSLTKVDRNAIELCLRLRERVQHNMDTYVTPGKPKPVVITDQWIVEADRMLRLDGIEMARAVEVVEWSTSDPFWRSNIRSMVKLREQIDRLMMDDKFLKWREKAGLVQWPTEVAELCDSMVKLLNFVYKGEEHAVNPLWCRGAASLLTRFSKVDIEDMMEWSLKSPKYISNVGSLLLFEWVSDGIRHDNAFILWSKSRGREWAKSKRAIDPAEARRALPGAKEKARRIGNVADDAVFKALAAPRPNQA